MTCLRGEEESVSSTGRDWSGAEVGQRRRGRTFTANLAGEGGKVERALDLARDEVAEVADQAHNQRWQNREVVSSLKRG